MHKAAPSDHRLARLASSSLFFPLLGAVLVVSWSSGFVGIRYATVEASVFMVLFWRSLVSGALLLPFALARGPRITLRALAEQAAFAFLGMFLYLGGFALAIGQRVPTGLVALMADLVPLAIAAMSLPILGQRLTGRQWLGTAIGLAGVLVVSADAFALGDAPAMAYLLPVLGMISFALATVLQERRRSRELAIHQRLCLQCLFAAAFFAPCAVLYGGIVPPLTGSFAFGIGWLVFVATYGAWITSLPLPAPLFPDTGVGHDLSQPARHHGLGLGHVRRAADGSDGPWAGRYALRCLAGGIGTQGLNRLFPPLPNPPLFLYAPAICDVRPCPRPHATGYGGRRQWGRQT